MTQKTIRKTWRHYANNTKQKIVVYDFIQLEGEKISLKHYLQTYKTERLLENLDFYPDDLNEPCYDIDIEVSIADVF